MKLLKMSDLVDLTGLGKSTIYKEISEGRFPKPIKIAERTSVWTETDITNWLNSKIKHHNANEGDDRDYIVQLEDRPSGEEIYKFVDHIIGKFVQTAENEITSIQQRLFQERALLIQEAVRFAFGDDGSNR